MPICFGHIAEHERLCDTYTYMNYNTRLFMTSKRFCVAMITLVYYRQR